MCISFLLFTPESGLLVTTCELHAGEGKLGQMPGILMRFRGFGIRAGITRSTLGADAVPRSPWSGLPDREIRGPEQIEVGERRRAFLVRAKGWMDLAVRNGQRTEFAEEEGFSTRVLLESGGLE